MCILVPDRKSIVQPNSCVGSLFACVKRQTGIGLQVLLQPQIGFKLDRNQDLSGLACAKWLVLYSFVVGV